MSHLKDMLWFVTYVMEFLKENCYSVYAMKKLFHVFYDGQATKMLFEKDVVASHPGF